MRIVLLFTQLLLCISSSSADSFDAEFTTTGGFIGNIVKDSATLEDNYSTNSLTSNLYVGDGALFSFTASHTYYVFNPGLSNLLLKSGMTLVPTDDSSRWTVFWSANRRIISFQEEDTEVSTSDVGSTDYDVLTSVGYKVSGSASVRFGHSFFSTDYANKQVRNNNRNEWFAGGNMTVLGRASVDLEIGYSKGEYYFAPETRLHPIVQIDTTYPIKPGDEYSVLESGDLKSVYISPRLSGKVGRTTGYSLTYSYREFIDRNDRAVVYGHTTGAISPWASSYEGSAVSLSVKSYRFTGFIITTGAGYWDKRYLKTMERQVDSATGLQSPLLSTRFAKPRQDYQRRLFLGLQRPIGSPSGRIIEPSLRIDYTSNSSSIGVYDYTDFSISTGLDFKF